MLREHASAPTIKLQKRLAEAGLGSRRAMEELIQAGEVSVNGRIARLGLRVGAADRIVVSGRALDTRRPAGPQRQARVLLYHKPEGEIVSRSDPEGRPSVFDRLAVFKRDRWLAIGRLDFNTCGLLVFTDSGELANRLSHPRFQARRDYAVRIVGELGAEQIRRLRTGIELEDGKARFDLVEPQGGEGTNRWYRVRVREGRNRLVRRMFAALGVTVSRLMRTVFGPFELPPRLKRGQWLRLEPAEVKQALIQLDRAAAGGDAGAAPPAPASRLRSQGEARRLRRVAAREFVRAKPVARPGTTLSLPAPLAVPARPKSRAGLRKANARRAPRRFSAGPASPEADRAAATAPRRRRRWLPSK
ncbi:MAG: pseudouridine synthase [Burkholderiales bacterium]|nr:pseudouridine synthase [Burkholderiales bacterium]